MRTMLLTISVLITLTCASRAQTDVGPTLVPDRDTVVRLGSGQKGFEALRDSRGVTVQVADSLPDGRVPAVVLVLVPADRKRAGWEQEIGLLEKKIALLEAEKAEADMEQEYQLARKIDVARKDMEFIHDRVRASGKNIYLADFQAVELGIVVLKKTQGQWTLVQALKLGSYDVNKLGAAPADADMQVRMQDFNRNGFKELKLSIFVDLLIPQLAHSFVRSHSFHFLVEFFPQGARTTFQLNGGIDSGGMCEGPLDGMTTAKFWIKSPKRNPAELSVSRARSMCERGQDPLKDRPGFERFAWSDKYRRWQPFSKVQPDAFLIVAASSRDKDQLQKTLRKFKNRNIRRRSRLGRSYPRIVTTDDFTGLKAGYHLLVLGSCPDYKQAHKVMRKIRKRFRGRGLSYSVRGYRRRGAPRLKADCPRPR